VSTIARLRALLAEATPGPWEAEDTSDVNDDLFSDDERESPLSTGWFRGQVGKVDVGDYSTLTFADAALMVEAVNALPALLDVVEAARVYLACDGSGVRAPEPWSAPFDAMGLAKALPALRAALDRLDGAS